MASVQRRECSQWLPLFEIKLNKYLAACTAESRKLSGVLIANDYSSEDILLLCMLVQTQFKNLRPNGRS